MWDLGSTHQNQHYCKPARTLRLTPEAVCSGEAMVGMWWACGGRRSHGGCVGVGGAMVDMWWWVEP